MIYSSDEDRAVEVKHFESNQVKYKISYFTQTRRVRLYNSHAKKKLYGLYYVQKQSLVRIPPATAVNLLVC